MARDITRKRSNYGTTRKTSPKVENPTTQLAIDAIYKELNDLTQAVAARSRSSMSTPTEGKDGDIRLYSEQAADGSIGYFVQGKFGENWASGRLSFDGVDPKQVKSVSSNHQGTFNDGGGYITRAGVTYENLDLNEDVGENIGQVAKGNHAHDHDGPFITNTGTYTHEHIDNHIGNLVSETVNDDIHRLPSDDGSDYTNTVSNAVDSGTNDTWARSDHKHSLDGSVEYLFTAKQTISVSSGNTALDIDGDVYIDGNVTIDFAEAGTGNTDISDNLSVGQNVVLNDDAGALSGGSINDTHTTTIHGKVYHKNIVDITHPISAGESHLSIHNDTDYFTNIRQSIGEFIVEPNIGNIVLKADGAVIPKDNIITDLGLINRKWRTVFCAELYAETLVAQDVLATIGGRIMVAPTTTLAEDVVGQNVDGTNTPSTSISVNHNIFEQNDYALLKGAPLGTPIQEVMQITSEGTYDYAPKWATTNAQYEPLYAFSTQWGSTTPSQTQLDYWPDVDLDSCIAFLYDDWHGLSTGDWIKIENCPSPPVGKVSWNGWYRAYFPDHYKNDETPGVSEGFKGYVFIRLPDDAMQTPDGDGDLSWPEVADIRVRCFPITYNVTRDVDETGIDGGNFWYTDDAVVNLGHETGDGYIEITSTETIHNDVGPAITLYSREDGTDVWDNAKPQINIGQLNGYAGLESNSFGLIVGKNLTNDPAAASDPFQGVLSTESGLDIYNTDFSIYDGTSLSSYIGYDSNGKNIVAFGNDINTSDWSGSDFLFKWDPAADGGNGRYKLTLNSDVNLSIDTEVTEEDVMDAIDHFLIDTNNPDQRGLYLTPGWLGFYESAGTYWPVKLGATASGTGGDPFFELKNAANNPTQFLRYTIAGGVEVAGTITIMSGSQFEGGTDASDVESNANEAQGWGNHADAGYTNQEDIDDAIDNIDFPDSDTGPGTVIVNESGLNFVNDGPHYITWDNSYHTGQAYLQVLITDAEGGCAIHYTDEGDDYGTANWTLIGNPSKTTSDPNGNNMSEEWYQLPFDITASDYQAIRFQQSGADGWTVKAVVVSFNYPVDGESIINGNWDVLAQEEITDTITIGGGSIVIGNTNNSTVSTYGKSFDDSTEGFIIGYDNTGAVKFEIQDASSDTYIKYDPTPSAGSEKITIKGMLHADRLANVTPRIWGGSSYLPMTQLSRHYDGFGDSTDGLDVLDYSSSRYTIENIRPGAIITVRVDADAVDSGSGGSHWVNPSLYWGRTNAVSLGPHHNHNMFGDCDMLPLDVPGAPGRGWAKIPYIGSDVSGVFDSDEMEEQKNHRFFNISDVKFNVMLSGSELDAPINYGDSWSWPNGYGSAATTFKIHSDNGSGISNSDFEDMFGYSPANYKMVQFRLHPDGWEGVSGTGTAEDWDHTTTPGGYVDSYDLSDISDGYNGNLFWGKAYAWSGNALRFAIISNQTWGTDQNTSEYIGESIFTEHITYIGDSSFRIKHDDWASNAAVNNQTGDWSGDELLILEWLDWTQPLGVDQFDIGGFIHAGDTTGNSADSDSSNDTADRHHIYLMAFRGDGDGGGTDGSGNLGDYDTTCLPTVGVKNFVWEHGAECLQVATVEIAYFNGTGTNRNFKGFFQWKIPEDFDWESGEENKLQIAFACGLPASAYGNMGQRHTIRNVQFDVQVDNGG